MCAACANIRQFLTSCEIAAAVTAVPDSSCCTAGRVAEQVATPAIAAIADTASPFANWRCVRRQALALGAPGQTYYVSPTAHGNHNHPCDLDTRACAGCAAGFGVNLGSYLGNF
jgi:hypothetical protein